MLHGICFRIWASDSRYPKLRKLRCFQGEIVIQSDELLSFDSPSPDDHIKIFFPVVDGGGTSGLARLHASRMEHGSGYIDIGFCVAPKPPRSRLGATIRGRPRLGSPVCADRRLCRMTLTGICPSELVRCRCGQLQKLCLNGKTRLMQAEIN